MKYQKWHIGTAAEGDTALLREAGYPGLLATVLASRGITTAEAAAEALERETTLTLSPMLMRDMDKAVARIQRALANDETIAVFGDYDVDGITSTVLLLDYLKGCGAHCLRYIPRRIEDGYGLSRDAIAGLREQGATLMITVDCGSIERLLYRFGNRKRLIRYSGAFQIRRGFSDQSRAIKASSRTLPKERPHKA